MRFNPVHFSFSRVALTLLFALAVVAVLIMLVSSAPLEAMYHFFIGPWLSLRRMGNMLELMIPLMFAGLATMFIFKAGLFNLAIEGAIYSAAAVAAMFSLSFSSLPVGVNLVLSILAAMITGALIAAIPAWLKLRCRANEIVTSLMLNFVCLNLGLFFVQTYFQDPTISTPYSFRFPEGVSLGFLILGTRIHAGLIIVLIVVILGWWSLERTRLGLNLRLIGANVRTARLVGLNTDRLILISQLLAGMVAGLGGAVELFGMYQRFQWTALTGFGWEGIPIAIIARFNPRNLPWAAGFFAYIRIGADIMARSTDVPFEMIQIIHALLLILITAQVLWNSKSAQSIIGPVEEWEVPHE